MRFTDVRRVSETASTNDDVLALARVGAAEGVVVVADHQTAGRGRQGRSWQAPPGASLLVTVLLRPAVAVADLVTMAAGLAMTDAVLQVAGVAATLKWPNDLVVSDRKLGGMLAEAEWRDGRVAVAVGIGVNVTWAASLPSDLAETAVALNHLTGGAVDRDVLLAAYLDRLEARYSTLLARRGRAATLDAWRARSATLGRAVRIELADGAVTGTAVDVTDLGHLVVESDGGARHTFAAGDVVHLRGTD